ncbi:hypothetical protein MBEHAL_0379 [Halarchaeum acidiphilum MH1-52-1]|uniref:Uncharacterized protein n=1 Tax=Halarchaeum acidiphilum MH1-52-1 TaxID=1261545 RepID=U3A1U0_9EURY|nr:hypothetical protein MBEHAL_0379 [Halarchaeum acidiphilum MH1-52-1]
MGTILLTGIVVVTVTVSGVAVLDRAYGGGGAANAPIGSVDVTVHDGSVTVTRCGGESLDGDDLVAVLRGSNGTKRVPFANGSWTDDGDGATGSFSPGMTWTYPYENESETAIGDLTESDVSVVHTPSNTALDTTECGGRVATTTTTAVTTTTTTSTPSTTTPTPSGGDESTPPVSLNVTLVDRSGPNDRAAYDVTYALDAAEANRTANVSVAIRNEATGAVRNDTDLAAAAGTNRVSYDASDAAGDNYTVTVRAHGTSGDTLDTETVTDVADGVDSDDNGTVERAGEPLRAVTLADRTGPDDGAAYTIGYEATDAVANVSVALVDTDGEWTLDTSNASVPSSGAGAITVDPATDAGGDAVNVTVHAYDASGDRIDAMTYVDVADGRDTHDTYNASPAERVAGVAITDRSDADANRASYAVDYEFGASGLHSVVAFHDLDAGTTTMVVGDGGTATYRENGTYGDEYAITVLAVTSDGAVVDHRTVRDTAAASNPGFAYTDVDGDGVYDAEDRRVNASDLADGYSSDERLVVPKSVSVSVDHSLSIAASGIDLRGTIETTNENGDVTLDSRGHSLETDGGTVRTTGQKASLHVEAGGGHITFRNATVSTEGKNAGVAVTSRGGAVSLRDTTVNTTGQKASLEITGKRIAGTDIAAMTDGKIAALTIDGEQTVTLNRTALDTDGQKADLSIESDGVDLRGATIDTDGKTAGLTIDGRNGSARLGNANITTTGRKADVEINAGEQIGLGNATVMTASKNAGIRIDGDARIDLRNGTLSTTGQKAALTVEGTGVDLRDGSLSTNGKNAGMTIDGRNGSVRLENATVTTAGQKAGIDITGNTIEGRDAATITANGSSASVAFHET